MSLLPKIRAKYGQNLGVELFFAFPDLSDDEKSYFDADSAAGDTTITASGANFATSQYIVVGQPGNEKTEIIQLSTSVAPTATLITLATALQYPHNRGDLIRFIPYNQIALEYSTDSGVNYLTTTAVAIRADASETYMQRTADLSTYYYRFRFYNSTSTLYSAYSNVALAVGYPANSRGSIKARALSELGEELGDLIHDEDMNDWLDEGRRTADQNPATFRWSFRTMFDVNIGYLLAGQYKIAAPTDLRDRNTPKNILSLRMGQQNRPCVFQDRNRFNQNYLNVAHTTLSVAASSGATSLTLTNSRDFDASGTITVSSGVLGTGVITVTYTANNKTTGVLTGVTGLTANVAAAVDIWQRYVPGLPTGYTVDNAVISFDTPLLTTYDGQNVHMDYYTAMTALTDDSSVLDEPFYDLYVSWLKWKIKYLKANGKIDRDGDTDYKDFVTGIATLVMQETPSQRINFVPDIEGFLSATE